MAKVIVPKDIIKALEIVCLNKEVVDYIVNDYAQYGKCFHTFRILKHAFDTKAFELDSKFFDEKSISLDEYIAKLGKLRDAFFKACDYFELVKEEQSKCK